MTEVQLILILPAILCILIGIVLVSIEKCARREEIKRAQRRAERRAHRAA